MKIRFSFIVLFFLTAGFLSAQQIADSLIARPFSCTRMDTRYFENTGNVKGIDYYTGLHIARVIKYYPNGNLEYVAKYDTAGLKTWDVLWHTNGRLMSVAYYRNNFVSNETGWDSTGALIRLVESLNGDTTVCTEYFADGTVKTLGKKYYHGFYIEGLSYYKGGVVQSEWFCGKNGFYRRYYPDGKLYVETGRNANGLVSGYYRMYYPNGKVKVEGALLDTLNSEYVMSNCIDAGPGCKKGVWKYYNEKGVLESEEEYEKGRLIESRQYKNGKLISVSR